MLLCPSPALASKAPVPSPPPPPRSEDGAAAAGAEQKARAMRPLSRHLHCRAPVVVLGGGQPQCVHEHARHGDDPLVLPRLVIIRRAGLRLPTTAPPTIRATAGMLRGCEAEGTEQRGADGPGEGGGAGGRARTTAGISTDCMMCRGRLMQYCTAMPLLSAPLPICISH